jgi:hypothetical protein
VGKMNFSDGVRIKYSKNDNASLAIDPNAGWVALSYTILLEDQLCQKKWNQKHGGFRPFLTPFPW